MKLDNKYTVVAALLCVMMVMAFALPVPASGITVYRIDYCLVSIGTSCPPWTWSQQQACITALKNAMLRVRGSPYYMHVRLGYRSNMNFATAPDFITWWQGEPYARNMKIFLVDEWQSADPFPGGGCSGMSYFNVLGFEEGSIFHGDYTAWIACKHLHWYTGQPPSGYPCHLPHTAIMPQAVKSLFMGCGMAGQCPLGDLLGWLYECNQESVTMQDHHHPDTLCGNCYNWYKWNVKYPRGWTSPPPGSPY